MFMATHLIGFGAGGDTPVVPTTWNPSDKGSDVTLGGGNLQISFGGTTNTVVRSIYGAATGKWYWEIACTGNAGASNGFIGIANSTHSLNQNELGVDTNGWSYKGLDGNKNTNNTPSAYGNSWASGDVIGVALDMDAGKVWFAKNGTWQASGDPAGGTNEAFSGISGTIHAAYAANATNWTSTANFGASAFTHTVPSGFRSGFGA